VLNYGNYNYLTPSIELIDYHSNPSLKPSLKHQQNYLKTILELVPHTTPGLILKTYL